jgi:hypothetical protein
MLKTKRKNSKVIQIRSKANLEFKTNCLREFVNIIPIYLLTGITSPDPNYDILGMAESFSDEDGSIHTELWDLAEYLSTPTCNSESIMEILYSGWNKFDNYKDLDEINLDFENYRMKSKPSILHASKYMIAGFAYKDWYSETYKAFTDLLPSYDMELFVRVFAATSPMSHLKSNLSLALKAYKKIIRGESLSDLGAINSVKRMLDDIRGGTFQNVSGNKRRKILNFESAIWGNTEAVVVDSQMLRAYNMAREYLWKGKTIAHLPTGGEYNFIENHIRSLAKATRYEPRQIVSMLWSGIRVEKRRFKDADTRKILESLL